MCNNKNKKRNSNVNNKRSLVTTLVVLAVCLVIVTGSTFSLFTSSTGVNIAVTAANVKLVATINQGSMKFISMGETQAEQKFANGGTANLDDNGTFQISNITPGDRLEFDIDLENTSTIDIKYRVKWIIDGELAGALTATADDKDITVGTSEWTLWEASDADNGKIEVAVEFPAGVQGVDYNALQGKTAKIDFIVEAVQGNGTDGYETLVYVNNQETLQAALDNAAPNTVIRLAPGVDYGVVYLRPVAGTAPTKEVDWIGNNYRYETYSLFENLTIIGSTGATIDAIEIEGGTYYNTEHSQDDLYPVMLSLVELKNVVLDGVTFTGKGGYDPQGYGNVVNLAGGNIKVDGLTFKNCVLNNEANNARLLYKTESTTHVHNYAFGGETFTFIPTLKNITITECTFNGGYMGLELRETENLTITGNVFNVGDRNILLASNTGCAYSGNVTITGNISNNAQERFLRADGMGDAVVVVKDNILNAYMGEDDDYIKVTNANNVTLENNVLNSRGIMNAEQFKAALTNGGVYVLLNDVTVTEALTMNSTCDINLNGYTLNIATTASSLITGGADVTIKNGFVDISDVVIAGNNGIFKFNGNVAGGNTLTLEDVEFSGEGFTSYSVFWLAEGQEGTPNILNFVDSKFDLKNEVNPSGGFIKHPSYTTKYSGINITNSVLNFENITRLFLYGVYNIKDSEINFVDTTGTSNGFRQGSFTIDNSKVTISGGDKGISPRLANTVIKNGSVVTINNVTGNDVIFEYGFDILVDSTSTITYNTVSGNGGGKVTYEKLDVDPAPLEEDLVFTAGTNAVVYKDMVLTGNEQITHTDNAVLLLYNVVANVNGDVIVRKSSGAIAISNCEFTLAEGAKLITVGEGGDGYQVFLINVKVNGVLLTRENAGQYLEGISWFDAVSE